MVAVYGTGMVRSIGGLGAAYLLFMHVLTATRRLEARGGSLVGTSWTTAANSAPTAATAKRATRLTVMQCMSGDLSGGRAAPRPRRRSRALLPDHAPEQAHEDEEAREEGDQAEAAVRRVGTLVRNDEEPDAEDDCPGYEQRGEEELRVRAGDRANPALPSALGRHRGARKDQDHQAGNRDRGAEFDRVLEGDREELHGDLVARAERSAVRWAAISKVRPAGRS